MSEQRKYAAIMFTDIVSYTALMGKDEDKAFDMLARNRKIHVDCIRENNGKLIKEIGDGTLVSFSLASEAARCAVNIQKECKKQEIPLRIGIHEGETVFAGADVFGDGVNVASRLHSESKTGCITISDSIYIKIRNKTDLKTRFIKKKSYKNVDEPIKIYQLLWGNEKEESLKTPGLTKRKKHLLYVLSGIVIIILAILVARSYLIPETSLDTEKSIAVLPFENQSEDNEYTYFGDALTDEIIMQLQKIKDFKVRSNTSVMKYKESDLTTPEIAEELQVNYIIEGTAQRFQNKVRIRVQLIDAITDEHVWGDTYDRAWGDIFTLQGDIAMQIAGQLETILSPEEINEIESIPTENLVAYEYYLKARKFHTGISFNYTNSDIGNAIYFYEKALELDPTFGLAYVGLGCAKLNQTYWDDYYKENFGDSLLWYVNKALSFNPDLPDALLWKGMYYYLKEDLQNAIIQYQKILDKQPNHGVAYWWLGISQEDQGKYLEALVNFKRAENLLIGDPQYGVFLGWYYRAYLNIMDFDNAEIIARRRMDIDLFHGLNNLEQVYYSTGDVAGEEEIVNKICALDSSMYCIGYLSYIHSVRGNYELALDYFQKFEALRNLPNNYGLGEQVRKAYLLNKLNRKKEAEIILQKEIDYCLERIKLGRAFSESAEISLVACYALQGQKEKSYEVLHKMEEKRFPGGLVSSIQVDPLYESLREDEEFKQIIRRQEKKYAEIRAEIARLESSTSQP